MAMQYVENELRRTGDPRDLERAAIIRARREARREDIPSPSIKDLVKVPELELQGEWERQSKRYIELGFHKELDLTEEEYRASLPEFTPQPESFRGRFDIPLLVETRISPKRQAELAGLGYYLDGLNVRDWEDGPEGYKTPEVPYTTWVQDGKKNLHQSVLTVRKNFATDERGATEFDGIALYINNPKVLNDHGVDLPGTSVESDLAPFLDRWNGEPEVCYKHVDHAHPSYGSVSCGRV